MCPMVPHAVSLLIKLGKLLWCGPCGMTALIALYMLMDLLAPVYFARAFVPLMALICNASQFGTSGLGSAEGGLGHDCAAELRGALCAFWVSLLAVRH